MILTPWFWLTWPVIITTTFVSFFSISGSYENTGWTEQLSLPKKKPWTRFQTLPTAPGGPIIGTSYSSLPPFPFSLFVLHLSFYSLLSSSPPLLFFSSLIITPSLFSSLPFYSLLFSFLLFSLVCLDTSWSMAGPRENLAKAVVLECTKQGDHIVLTDSLTSQLTYSLIYSLICLLPAS